MSHLKTRKRKTPKTPKTHTKLTKKKIRKTYKKLNKLKKYKRKTQKGGAFIVTVAEPSEYVIETNSNRVNNSTIFKIVYKGCVRHFFVEDENLEFKILYLDDYSENNGILVKRSNDTATDESYIETITEFIKNNRPMDLQKDFLTQHKIIRLQWNSSLCEKEINISPAKPAIEELTSILQSKCPNLSLSLDYVYNMNGDVVTYSGETFELLLCLNETTQGCISSLEATKIGRSLIIASRTKPEFEGKKYNKLLIAAIITIARLLKCKLIVAMSVNPITTWLLMNYFNATISDNDSLIDFLFDKHVLPSKDPEQIITKDILTKELMQEFHEIDDIELEIVLTNLENIENAKRVFTELITTEIEGKGIQCT